MHTLTYVICTIHHMLDVRCVQVPISQERWSYAGHMLLYADTSISYVTLGISYK